MPAYRVTWFFEGVQQATRGSSSAYGWTESWFISDDTLTIDAVFTHPDVTNYLTVRQACLSSYYRIPWVRVSDDANPRLTKIASLGNTIGKLFAGTNDPQVQCAVLVDLQRLPAVGVATDKVHHRRFMLRGLGGEIVSGNVLNEAAPGWAATKNFFDFIGIREFPAVHGGGPVATKLGCRYHDTSVQYVSITEIVSQALSGHHSFSVTPLLAGAVGGPPGVGSKVEVRDVAPPLQVANRFWTVLDLIGIGPTPGMSLGRSRKTLPSDDLLGAAAGGKMRLVKWLYGPFSQYALIGLRTKKTGRLFRQPRGRSSSRG